MSAMFPHPVNMGPSRGQWLVLAVLSWLTASTVIGFWAWSLPVGLVTAFGVPALVAVTVWALQSMSRRPVRAVKEPAPLVIVTPALRRGRARLDQMRIDELAREFELPNPKIEP